MTYDPQTGIGKINPAGVDHYRRVLRELNSAGLDVALTMWHWDTPLVLENRAFTDQSCTVPGGHTGSFWLCDSAASYFEQYVQVLLDEFAPLIKFWNIPTRAGAMLQQNALFLRKRSGGAISRCAQH